MSCAAADRLGLACRAPRIIAPVKADQVQLGGIFAKPRRIVASRHEKAGLFHPVSRDKKWGDRLQVEEVLAHLESNMSPDSLRDFAKTVLRLADAIEQNWSPNSPAMTMPLFSRAAQIRRNAISLSLVAVREERRSAIREEVLGFDLMGIPAWTMLLELFKQKTGDAKVSTKSLQIISRMPETSALRLIGRLEEQGLVSRSTSPEDRRVTFVELTKNGLVKVGTILDRINV